MISSYDLIVFYVGLELQTLSLYVLAAFDKNQKPTKATLGFAKSCSVEVEELKKLETEKGSWLIFDTIIKAISISTWWGWSI